jgi:hypothetical protein
MGIMNNKDLNDFGNQVDNLLNPDKEDREFGYALVMVPFKDNPNGQLQMVSNFLPEIAVNLLTDASRLLSAQTQQFNVKVDESKETKQ